VGFFHSGTPFRGGEEVARAQKGVVRTNCIDSLDRTNAAQFVLAKCALGHQLHAMGMQETPMIGFDQEIVVLLMSMYQDMGNHIALQYAGSHLVNTMQTYSINNAHTIASHSRDILVTIKRYYSNSFTDAEKQDSINLFLGYYVPWKQAPQDGFHLWELESDYYLHNRKSADSVLCSTPWWRKPIDDFKRRHVVKVSHDDSQRPMLGWARSPEGVSAKNTDGGGPSNGSAVAARQRLSKQKYSLAGGFEDFYRVHNITLFDKELALPFNEAELSESSQLQHQKQKVQGADGNPEELKEHKVTLKTFMDQNNPPGAQYINGMKRWMNWWAQSGISKKATHCSTPPKEKALPRSPVRQVTTSYGIALREFPRELGFYKRYLDVNGLSKAAQSGDQKMDYQLYHTYIDDDCSRFIESLNSARADLSYGAFLSQDFANYVPSPQDASIYESICENDFDSVGDYAAHSAHSHGLVAIHHHTID